MFISLILDSNWRLDMMFSDRQQPPSPAYLSNNKNQDKSHLPDPLASLISIAVYLDPSHPSGSSVAPKDRLS